MTVKLNMSKIVRPSHRFIKSSVFDSFKEMRGPSSSHTLGGHKMGKAMRNVILGSKKKISRVTAHLINSFSFTGKGHKTDIALFGGLAGFSIKDLKGFNEMFSATQSFVLNKELVFNPSKDIIFEKKFNKAYKPNTAVFKIYWSNGKVKEYVFESVGGGKIKPEEKDNSRKVLPEEFRFNNWETFSQRAKQYHGSIVNFIIKREQMLTSMSKRQIKEKMKRRFDVMMNAVEAGKNSNGSLGGLTVRRAPKLFEYLDNIKAHPFQYAGPAAMAVSEENADMGLIVTAPTGGGGGVLPGVLYALKRYGVSENKLIDSLFIAGSICQMIEYNACVSGAKAACAFEIIAGESMVSAAGVFALLGHLSKQNMLDKIEQGAEMPFEHNLGLTCAPVKGQVLIPCVERNLAKASEAIGLINTVVAPNPQFFPRVGFDSIVKTAYDIGRKLPMGLRETSRAGLAKTKLKPKK